MGATPPSPPAPAAGPRFPGRIYPGELEQLEVNALRERRAAVRAAYARATPGAHPALPADVPATATKLPADTVGLALSGGGIRSATFCLGVVQALARRRLLGHVDFLSTVSGGGYLGGFWTGWIDRLHRSLRRGVTDPAATPKTFADAEHALADQYSPEVKWLRENGRYLTPNGGGDAWFAAAAYQRNLLSVHVVLGVLLMGVMALGIALRELVLLRFPDLALMPLWATTAHPVIPSIAFYLPLGFLILGVACGFLYWVILPKKLRPVEEWLRNRTTKWLAFFLGLGAMTFGIALLDTIGLTVTYWWYDQLDGNFWATFGGVVTGLYLGISKVKGWLEKLQDSVAVKPSLGLLALGGALAVAALWLIALSFGAHLIVQSLNVALGYGGMSFLSNAPQSYLALIAPGVALLLVAALLGFSPRFVNLSSFATLYSARLTRAYLGASNPARRNHSDVTETIPGDEVDFENFFPHRAGGPLHLINVTINQTADTQSAIVQFDRKGLNLAVGPCGLTAGVKHHSKWNFKDTGPRDGTISAIEVPGQTFHLFKRKDTKKVKVEMLGLGKWVGISGAAVSTGLGAQTSPSYSFLLGFFNVRLGWWWNSGITPSSRPNQKSPSLRWDRGDVFSKCFPSQSQLLDEMRAYFCGPARRHWYLTDGGHFENTAAYELIRRRVPFILICDDGCDPERQLADLANLVRKARLDFDAEITVLDPDIDANNVPVAVRPFLAGPQETDPLPEKPAMASKPALLARAVYENDPSKTSLILMLKPTVVGQEPMDVLNYRTANVPFPQESTGDQSYDEAQWESYRRLGDFIATKIVEQLPPGKGLYQLFG